MQYDCLRTIEDNCYLFNATVDESEFVRCGVAFFQFGFKNPLSLTTLKNEFVCKIIPPESVQNARTASLLSDPLDQVSILKG
jgi:hypothetical protein